MKTKNGKEAKAFVVGSVAFVPVDRTVSGAMLYVKTDSSVGLVGCESCRVRRGRLCQGTKGTLVRSHPLRRRRGRDLMRLRDRGSVPVFEFEARVEEVE